MTILDQIIADTREELSRRKRDVPVSRLQGARYFSRSPLNFADALRSERPSVIAEVKKASPSKGIIREEFEPAGIASAYEDSGAAAVSVLTEPLHFKGSLDDLASVRAAVDLPLLRKDFIVDAYQLFEARASGADAVLLIAAVLDKFHLHDLVQASRELGLATLVEVYETSEIDRIDFDEVSILGVNNRDLRSFEVDVDYSVRVFQHVPREIVRVSESGLSSAKQLFHLSTHGIDAVLIGETFLRADKPGDVLAQLRDEVAELQEQEQEQE
jgi:indole-3-glycerol phosphate synthase